jgi:hypothetical protein
VILVKLTENCVCDRKNISNCSTSGHIPVAPGGGGLPEFHLGATHRVATPWQVAVGLTIDVRAISFMSATPMTNMGMSLDRRRWRQY